MYNLVHFYMLLENYLFPFKHLLVFTAFPSVIYFYSVWHVTCKAVYSKYTKYTNVIQNTENYILVSREMLKNFQIANGRKTWQHS